MGELTAFSTIVLVGYMSAPPTLGSVIWAEAWRDVRARTAAAAEAKRLFLRFMGGVFL